MNPINEIGFYQLENLVLQRVPFVLFDLTKDSQFMDSFSHLNSYYLNFLKNVIVKSTPSEFEKTEKFQSLAKEDPIVVISDDKETSKFIALRLESENYINVFYT